MPSITFSPEDPALLYSSDLNTIRSFDVGTGRSEVTLTLDELVNSIAVDGKKLFVSFSNIMEAWDLGTKRRRKRLIRQEVIHSLAVNPKGGLLAGAGTSAVVWELNGWGLKTLESEYPRCYCVSFDPSGSMLAVGRGNGALELWDPRTGTLRLSLEGHTNSLDHLQFDPHGTVLASKSYDGTIRLWRCDTWETIAVIPSPKNKENWWPGLAFHPELPVLATVGSERSVADGELDRVIHLWELDLPFLLGRSRKSAVTYTSAKIVLVGDSGVGKTGLGWRLAHGTYKEHSSTHGQQFWLLKELSRTRDDGAQCEAILWDLAGQPDYRLIRALFLDDADVALVLFDPTRNDDPLHGVEYWLKHLKAGQPNGIPVVLVAARSDRGSARITRREVEEFCLQRGIRAYFPTSASSGEGIPELVARMQALVPWEDKPATVTTETFKRIKDLVLGIKENRRVRKVVLTLADLRKRLETSDRTWKFSDAEVLTAAGHMANHGYVTRLKLSGGEMRVLLAPELLNNLAASFVLEARRQEKGLGSLEEHRLLSGEYLFPELKKLSKKEREMLLDSAAILFLEHNVCFRETDPLTSLSYLVFPELINLKKPLISEEALDDGVAYSVVGSVENVYASLVVLLGYTHTFTRTNQWRNQARYEVGNGMVCAFRQESEREGELQFVLSFGSDVGSPVRALFQSLFESFLARKKLSVVRYEPVACSRDHQINRVVVREQVISGADFAFCTKCGEKVQLPAINRPIQLTRRVAADVESQRLVASQRSRFEQAAFRWKAYVREQKITPPECFISYAWGDPEHARWVEHDLATDLLKAGIVVILDVWENKRIGSSVPRFVERAGKCDCVIVVGTPRYRIKYENGEPMRGFVVAAEGDLIGKRMIGSELLKESVLPVLLEGTEENSLPNLLHGRVYADFRATEAYFGTTFELILSVYRIPHNNQVAEYLREILRDPK